MLIMLLPSPRLASPSWIYVWHRQLVGKRFFEIADAPYPRSIAQRLPSRSRVIRLRAWARGRLESEVVTSCLLSDACWTD